MKINKVIYIYTHSSIQMTKCWKNVQQMRAIMKKRKMKNKKWHNWKPGKAAASENLTVNDKRRLKRQSVVELVRLGKKGNYMQWWIDWCTVLDQRIGFLLWNLVYHERITMRECLQRKLLLWCGHLNKALKFWLS